MKKILINWIGIVAMIQALGVGERLPHVTLQGSTGGMSDGRAWHSSSLRGKVHLILYMDPDKRKETQPLLDALKKLNVNGRAYSTVAIVNLAATWMPDAILETMLAKKQKELKNTIFIFDRDRYLVKKWQMKDNDTNILIIDKYGKILYRKSGKITSADIDKIIGIIKKQLN